MFTTCLWFDDQAEEAAHFYVSIFKDGRLGRVARYPEGAGPAGSVMTAEFEINGQRFVGLNGGPQFTFNEAVSLQVHCADQDEVDYYWSRLTDGGQESQCGWLKDRYGLSWQVFPDELLDMVADPDQTKAARAMQAMFGMTKLDLPTLRAAYEGSQ